MKDYLLKNCEEYPEELKSSINNIEAEAPIFYKPFYLNRIEEEKEQVRDFLSYLILSIMALPFILILVMFYLKQ